MGTKRRDAGSGSVYWDSALGLWAASVELGWRTVRLPDGTLKAKRDRKVVRAKTKPAVVKKLKELKQKQAEGAPLTRSGKVGDWLTRWVEEIRPTQTTKTGPIRPKTLANERSYVNNYLIPHLGHHRLEELETNPELVVSFVAAMRATPGGRGGGMLSEATVQKAFDVLSLALADANRMRKLAKNPCNVVDRPGAGPVQERFLDASGAARMIEHDPDGRWSFALLTGKRQGERLGLRWRLLDLDGGTANVSWQLQRLSYRHGCPPGDRCGRRFGGNCAERELDVPPGFEYEQVDGGLCLTRPKTHLHLIPLVPALVDRLSRRKAQVGPGPHDLVWTRKDGRPIDPRHDHDEWYAALRALDLPDVPPHSARHTCATTLLSLGVQEPVIMQLVGHSTLVSARRYLHADLEAARKAAVRLGQVLGVEPASPAALEKA